MTWNCCWTIENRSWRRLFVSWLPMKCGIYSILRRKEEHLGFVVDLGHY